jgi:hypothetical protein
MITSKSGRVFMAAVMIYLCGIARGSSPERSDFTHNLSRVIEIYSNISYQWRCQQSKLDGTVISEDIHEVTIDRGRFKIHTMSFWVEGMARKRFGPVRNTIRNNRYAASFEEKKDSRVISEIAASNSMSVMTMYSGPVSSRLLNQRTYYDVLRAPTTEFISDTVTEFYGQITRCAEIVIAGPVVEDKPIRLRFRLHFRTDLKWVCCGVQLFEDGHPQMQTEERYYYTPKGDDWPDLAGIEFYRYEANDDRMFKYMGGPVTNFVRHAEPFPDSTFMLSTYGLPEPAEQFPLDTRFTDPDAGIDPKRYPAPPPASGKGFPWWGWLLAALLLAVGIVLIRRSRKAPSPS